MKRITEDNSDQYGEQYNKKEYNILKPLIGTKAEPPFYDPNNIHCHIWKKGKLAIEDNPNIPTYAKDKINIKTCIYCKICHKVKDGYKCNVYKQKDVIQDIILTSNPRQSYSIIKYNRDEECKDIDIIDLIKTPNTYDKITSNIFQIEKKEISNYITIKN